jgi:hypothetical protein
MGTLTSTGDREVGEEIVWVRLDPINASEPLG